MIKSVSAFDGQITFNMWDGDKPTYYSGLVQRFADAHPELALRGEGGEYILVQGTMLNAFTDFLTFAGHTVNISFNIKHDADQSLADFREWWIALINGAEAREVFRNYQFVVTKPLVQAWLNAYLETRALKPLASEGLAPGSAKAADHNPLSETSETVSLPGSGNVSRRGSRKDSK